MAEIAVEILQGSAVTQRALGQLVTSIRIVFLQISCNVCLPKIMKISGRMSMLYHLYD